jgi:hypothetical protein
MIQQNELITFLVGTGAMLFILLNRRRIITIPGSRWLFFSYATLFSAWTFTVIEGFLLMEVMNFLEHACYMASSILAAVWCWTVLDGREKAE